jgi:hypothetical protein
MDDVKQKLEAVPVGAGPVREEFRDFAHDVDKTLELLAAALRGEKLVVRELPDLREDHHRLIRSANSEMFRFALVNEETREVANRDRYRLGAVLELKSRSRDHDYS